MKSLTTVPAHFDGKQIKIDVPIQLEPNTRLLITILDLDVEEDDENLPYVRYAMVSSEKKLAQIWDNDEDSVYDTL